MDLRQTTLKGIGWSFIDNILGSGITFLVGIVLARILSPEEFGLIGILTIIIGVSNIIIDSGFSNALIRKRNASKDDYNTVFYITLLLGIIMYLLVFLISPYISLFFKEPLLTLLSRIISIVLIINSLSIIPKTIFIKRIDFKVQAVVSAISSIISGIIGIFLAIYGFGIWSLVSQILSKQLINTILLWYYTSWRPNLIISVNSFRELFGFGSKLMIAGIIDTIYTNISQIVIGKFYSTNQLGQYTRAQQFQSIFSSNLTAVIQRVTYPVLSEIQEDQLKLRELYRKFVQATMLVTFFTMFCLAAISTPLLINLIGDKWKEASHYLTIICLSGALYPVQSLNLNMLQIKGRSDIFLKIEIIKKILGIVPILLGIFYSIESMLWSTVILSIISYILNSYNLKYLISYSTLDQTKDILPYLIISLLVSSVAYALPYFLGNGLFILFLQLMVIFFTTFVIYKTTNNKIYNELENIFLVRIRKTFKHGLQE